MSADGGLFACHRCVGVCRPQWVASIKLQVFPTVNPEGVLQHDVRSTDTIMDTAPVAYQSATTLSTPMHPMTIVKPRWGLGSDLTRTARPWTPLFHAVGVVDARQCAYRNPLPIPRRAYEPPKSLVRHMVSNLFLDGLLTLLATALRSPGNGDLHGGFLLLRTCSCGTD